MMEMGGWRESRLLFRILAIHGLIWEKDKMALEACRKKNKSKNELKTHFRINDKTVQVV